MLLRYSIIFLAFHASVICILFVDFMSFQFLGQLFVRNIPITSHVYSVDYNLDNCSGDVSSGGINIVLVVYDNESHNIWLNV